MPGYSKNAVKRRCLPALWLLLSALPSSARPLPGDAEKFDAQDVVKQAVINFKARESLPRDYTYAENTRIDHPGKPDAHSEETYEVIEIKGHAFRRHTIHNGQKISSGAEPVQDETYLAKWKEVEQKILEEQVKPGHTSASLDAAVQKIMADAGLQDWKPQLAAPTSAASMGVVVFSQSLYKFTLPLQDLDQEYDLKPKDVQIFNRRKTYVVQADPKHSTDKDTDAGNFKIKVWIDQQDLQIVKAEGKALRNGRLARANYSAFSSRTNLSQTEIDQRKQQLAESELLYGEGTTIVQEWIKVNDEVWLLHRRHAKGSHILMISGATRFPGANRPMPVEYEVTNTNYRKFRVEHRILPPGPDH